jgi:hypothetical protein
VIGKRALLAGIGAVGVSLVALGSVACGSDSSGASGAEYPLVERETPSMQEPVRMSNGAVVTLPALPTVYESEPSASCERELATFHDGSRPTRRPIVIPPMPGVHAVAVSEHTTRVEWSFRDLPADCRPASILISVRNGSEPSATPTTKEVEIHGAEGNAEIAYPEFLPIPTVAAVSAFTSAGHRSRTASVLIERSANVPPDPPAALPQLTAPAGRPLTCRGDATVVADPADDVLSYAPGSPPTQVTRMTPALAAIDIVRARVQIDGQTICASFTLAQSPGDADFWLTLTLMDATTASCCASLRFRRTAGRLELGHHTIDSDGSYKLRPVQGAGAALRDNTLVISGTLPPPSAWRYRTRRVPAPENIGWSATTGYLPRKYGPTYGDWLPRYHAIDQPMIRQHDGVTVRPGATP